jgi:dynein heavy chain, axonemal
MKQFEKTVINWTNLIRNLLEKVNKKDKIQNLKGPLGEIEYWKNRSSSLGTLYEQLNRKNVQKIIELLREYESNILNDFEEQFNDLKKNFKESKVKFFFFNKNYFKINFFF